MIRFISKVVIIVSITILPSICFSAGGQILNVTNIIQGGSATVREDGFDIAFGNDIVGYNSFRATWTTSGTATIWTTVPTLGTGTTTHYLYYNNPTSIDNSSFSVTFTKDYQEIGLVGVWHFDEGIGTTVNDSSGNGNTGTLFPADNPPTWQINDGGHWDGQTNIRFNSGSALSLNGTSSYIRVTNSASLNPNLISMSAWIKPQTGVVNTSKIISRDYRGDGTWNSPWIIYTLEYGYVEITTGGVITSLNFSGASLNNWHYYVGTYDGGNIRIYIDGVEVASTAKTGNLDYSVTTSNLAIGQRSPHSLGEFFPGVIDEVRIYNRALSLAEIQAYYERRKYAGDGVTITVSYGAEENNPGNIYPNFLKRRPIIITNSGNIILTNFQVRILLRVGASGIFILD